MYILKIHRKWLSKCSCWGEEEGERGQSGNFCAPITTLKITVSLPSIPQLKHPAVGGRHGVDQIVGRREDASGYVLAGHAGDVDSG